MDKIRFAQVTIMAALLLIGLSAFSYAWCWYGGNRGGYMQGMPGGYSGVINPEAYQKFMDDTVTIRESLAEKRAKYNALMANPSPDPQEAGKLAREITSLQEKLRMKARSYGISSAPYNRMGRMGSNMSPYGGVCPYCGGWGCW